MRVKVLGTRGEVESSVPYHSRHSGVLIDGKILFDLGEEEFLGIRLPESHRPAERRGGESPGVEFFSPQAIFITHLHPDHAFFVKHGQQKTGRGLRRISADWRIPRDRQQRTREITHQESHRVKRGGSPGVDFPFFQPNVEIFAPEGHENLPDLKVLKKKIKIGPYTIEPIPTHHSKLVKSQAYILQKRLPEIGEQHRDRRTTPGVTARSGGSPGVKEPVPVLRSQSPGVKESVSRIKISKKILYTGDMIWINKKYHQKLKGLDLVITEGSFIRKGGMIRKDPESGKLFGHNGIPDLVKFFKPFTNRILLVHFGEWFYKDMKAARHKIKKLARENNIRIDVGYDGLKIEI